MARKQSTNEIRLDLYTRVTDAIIAELQQGVCPWIKPWSAEHAAGRITRPLRHNLEPYCGINVVLLWSQATACGFAAPIWMTFRQALELGAHVRKGETGAMVVYANKIIRCETDDKGEESEREIPFLKAYTVFNVDQIEGPTFIRPSPQGLNPSSASPTPTSSSPRPTQTSATAASRPTTP